LEFFTIKELADHLHAHPGTIYRLSRQGRLPGGFRVGAKWLFNRATIERWERTQATTNERQETNEPPHISSSTSGKRS